MRKSWIGKRFPQHADDLRRLIGEHRLLHDEPLHVAVVYDPGHDPQDIFLVEVVGGFASDAVNPDRDLFEVTYGPSSGLSIADGEQLHLVLTNPAELSVAFQDRWPAASEISEALLRGDFEVLFQDEIGSRLLELIRE